MPQNQLAGRKALVTGGTRGIGNATARRLAGAGATVLLTGREEKAACAVAESIAAEFGVPAFGFGLEMADGGAADTLMDRLAVEHADLDIVVANAGLLNGGPIGLIPSADARLVVEVNVLGTFAVVQGAARIMIPRGSGSIVLITSLVAAHGFQGMAAYAATKGAIASLARNAATELGPQGIRVNAVAPGVVDTDMVAPFPREDLAASAERTPLRRLGTAEDVAAAVLFLAGDDASFITGHVLAVDGGLLP